MTQAMRLQYFRVYAPPPKRVGRWPPIKTTNYVGKVVLFETWLGIVLIGSVQ